MKLDRQAARTAVEAKLSKPLGLDVNEAASGIFRIVNSNMTNGIREVSVKKGYDPRDFNLVAFGGNGAVHAGVQARELGMQQVIVPRTASAFSAWGMLGSNIVINKMRTYIANLDHYDLSAVNALYDGMRAEAGQDISNEKLKQSGLVSDIEYNYYIDMHYNGETYEITVPLIPAGRAVTGDDIRDAADRFHEAHKHLHTFSNPDALVYIMNVKLEMVVRTNRPRIAERSFHGQEAAHALRTRRRAYCPDENDFREVPVYDGRRVACGNLLEGPCIIEEPATTIVVYRGQTATLNQSDCYEISVS